MLLDARAIGSAGGGSGAPVGATYITQIPDVTLTNEQALSLLATGILKSTTATGVVSIAIAGTDYQAADAFLTSIGLLGTAADKMIYTTAVDTAAETGLSAFSRSFLDDASEAAFKATVNLEIGVDVQAWDADLDTISGLAKTDSNFIVGDGVAWVVESGATARTSLGLGTIATLNSPLPIINGGSGQVTQQAAIDALTNVVAATNEHVLTKDTGTGNVIFKAAPATGAPVGATYIVQTPDGTLTNEQALSALATGLLKNTTTTGVLSIAAEGTDYFNPPFTDTNTLVKGSADPTKLLRFEVDGFSAGATRVMTPPNQDTTLAGLSVIETFTAKQTFTGGITAPGAGSDSEAFGSSATATAINSTAIGNSAAAGQEAVAIGKSASAATQSTVIGTSSTTTGQRNILIGYGNTATLSDLVLIGTNITSGRDSIVIGKNASCGSDGVVIGALATTGGSFDSIAIGLSASAAFEQGIAIGSGATTTKNNQAIFGSTANPIAELTLFCKTASTNAIQNVLVLPHISTGTPAAGFGTGILVTGESSTTDNQSLGRLTYEWATATHASRKALAKWTVFDTAEREAIRIEASGTVAMLGFLGATAIARPTTYTLAATATRTMPTPEAAFTGQDNAQAGAVYAKSADLITLQTRLDSVEGVLRQLIIDLASTSGYGLLVAS